MRNFLVGLSTLCIIVFGLITVSSAATFWWGGDLDVECIESADFVQRLQIDNGSTVIDRWLEIDPAADINQILAVALTAQSNGSKVNISLIKIVNTWYINGIRIVAP